MLAAVLGPALIRFLRRIAFRQHAYEDAPQTHQKKTGTPTMGGLLFLLGPLVALAIARDALTLALRVSDRRVGGDRVRRRLSRHSARPQPRLARAHQISRYRARGCGVPRPRRDDRARHARAALHRADPLLALVRALARGDPRDDARGQPHRRARRLSGRNDRAAAARARVHRGAPRRRERRRHDGRGARRGARFLALQPASGESLHGRYRFARPRRGARRRRDSDRLAGAAAA